MSGMRGFPKRLLIRLVNRLRVMVSDEPRRNAWLVQQGVLTIGPHTYGAPKIFVWQRSDGGFHGGKVVIGSFCSIADGVEIFTGGNHHDEWISAYPFRTIFGLPEADDDIRESRDVTIGHDVWIGMGAKILSGVSIGNGAVIGAYSLVTQDVRPYTVVAGHPATLIRQRFTTAEIDALTALSWWEWPLDRIINTIPLLCGVDVGALLASQEPRSTELSN